MESHISLLKLAVACGVLGAQGSWGQFQGLKCYLKVIHTPAPWPALQLCSAPLHLQVRPTAAFLLSMLPGVKARGNNSYSRFWCLVSHQLLGGTTLDKSLLSCLLGSVGLKHGQCS